MTVLGIDPGKKGGLALLTGSALLELHPYSGPALHGLLCRHAPDVVCVEQVHAMPGQGVTSMFTFGQGFGEIMGVCLANGYTLADGNLIPVTPQRWKRAYGLIGQDKAASVQTARALWPNANFAATPRSRKPSDGLCEAALIALYGAEYTKKEELTHGNHQD